MTRKRFWSFFSMRDSVKGVSTKDAILDATDRLLTRYGYKKMTIEDLAAEVGIGKGSVYLHFASKEEIVLSHIDRIVEGLKKNLYEIAADEKPCADRLKRMLVERVMHRFDSVQHYSQSINELLARVRPGLLDRRKRYFEEEARILAGVIEEGVRKGEFATGDALETARTLLTATNSLLPYSLSTQELGERSEIEKRVARLADTLLHGIVKHSKRS